MPRTTATLAASAIAAAAMLVTTASAAPAATGADHAPTPEAEAAGIDAPGDAALGWKQRSVRSRPSAESTSTAALGVPGIDVSGWQGTVDWAGQYAAGKRFAYVKATEGTGYTSSDFGHQYNGSYSAGLIRGAYHFALPDNSSGAAQANHFVDHGGGWSSDGKTLPGALDMEWNPYGATCFGKSQSAMKSWITDFLTTYKARTGRYPVIYTNTSWWNQCVGHDESFAQKSPLWIARYSSSVGTLPTGWGTHTFWQYTDTPIDQNVFNGSLSRLRVLAQG
ncbi:lysozyme [Janibacter sp. GS2]|uniref:lysozyme n=1 Tax=Janibacter sp. GS2 TaxID=3442646 RepID=UPI003EBC8F7E